MKYVCISDGTIETLTADVRSAEVKVGDIFVHIGEHQGILMGQLQIKGQWSHVPGLSVKRTDPKPFTDTHIMFLLRHENIGGDPGFFAQFKVA